MRGVHWWALRIWRNQTATRGSAFLLRPLRLHKPGLPCTAGRGHGCRRGRGKRGTVLGSCNQGRLRQCSAGLLCMRHWGDLHLRRHCIEKYGGGLHALGVYFRSVRRVLHMCWNLQPNKGSRGWGVAFAYNDCANRRRRWSWVEHVARVDELPVNRKLTPRRASRTVCLRAVAQSRPLAEALVVH